MLTEIQIRNDSDLDQVMRRGAVRSGQIPYLFGRENPQDSLTNWIWSGEEKESR